MVGFETLDRAVELGENDVVASIDADGELFVLSHEVHAPSEYWVVVAAQDKDLVLLQLLRERFAGVTSQGAEFMTWLQEHDIRHGVGSTTTEHRRPMRLSAKSRRRASVQHAKPTRAGP
jgi:hypothetical protein